jgi:hypothetical protein
MFWLKPRPHIKCDIPTNLAKFTGTSQFYPYIINLTKI